MYTRRQYRPHQKTDFIKAYREQCRAAADLLGADLAGLTFSFASVFHFPGDTLAGVRIEFESKERQAVWVEVMVGEGAKKVLDGRPS